MSRCCFKEREWVQGTRDGVVKKEEIHREVLFLEFLLITGIFGVVHAGETNIQRENVNKYVQRGEKKYILIALILLYLLSVSSLHNKNITDFSIFQTEEYQWKGKAVSIASSE